MFKNIITIDGPTASGKGTIAGLVAQRLGWHILDSGAMYRLLALALIEDGITDPTVDQSILAAQNLDFQVTDQGLYLNGVAVDQAIRQEKVGNLTSKIAAIAPVRDIITLHLRSFARAPGLVADGRDMGTVVFPHAPLKIFLDADVQVRAQRRFLQLQERGDHSANLAKILEDMQNRDERDRNRNVAPLKPAPDALTIDASNLTIDLVVQEIIHAWNKIKA